MDPMVRSELRNALISGLGTSGLKRAQRQRKRIRHRLAECNADSNSLLLRISTKYNNYYQDTMIAVELFGRTREGAAVKLGEQYFADKLGENQSSDLSLLSASVVYKWMLHERDYIVEISGFNGRFDDTLLQDLLRVTSVSVYSALTHKQRMKLEQLAVDQGGELQENHLALIQNEFTKLHSYND